MNVFVVGSGKLAEELVSGLHGDHIKTVGRWRPFFIEVG
jgi:hypothetical protein